MAGTISVLGDLRVAGSVIMDQNNVSFPLNPQLGTLVVKGLNLYAYLNIGSMQTWYPLISIGGNNYVHTQGVPSQEWVVTHNLNTAQYWYQIQDDLGNIVSPVNVVNIDSNSFRVVFSTPITGSIVVVSTSNMIVDKINASLISLGADVTIDTAGMTVAGKRVLTGVTLSIGDGATTQFTHTEGERLNFKAGVGISLAFNAVDKSVTINSPGSSVTPAVVDAAILAAMQQEVLNRNLAISAESDLRITADANAANLVVAEITTAINSEITARNGAISAEATLRISGDATEAAARDVAIANEVIDRNAAILVETNARTAADVATLAAAKTYADSLSAGGSTASTAAIAAEVARAQAAELALNNRINLSAVATIWVNKSVVDNGYTLAPNEGVFADTSGGSFTVNLPAAPVHGESFLVADAKGTWAQHNLIIAASHPLVFVGVTTLTCNVSDATLELTYDSVSATWRKTA